MNKDFEPNIYLDPEFIPFYYPLVREKNITLFECLVYSFIRFYTYNSKNAIAFNNADFAKAFNKNETHISETISNLVNKNLLIAEYITHTAGGKTRLLRINPKSEKTEVGSQNDRGLRENPKSLINNTNTYKSNISNTSNRLSNVICKHDIDTNTCSLCSFAACTDLQLWNIAKNMDLPLDDVIEKHKVVLETVESGEMGTKYKSNKSTYYTLRNWLRMAVDRGHVQHMNEMERMALDLRHPDNMAEFQKLKEEAKSEGII